ncbi:transglutaminase family protein [uncultured Methylobacterium sp.]|uniref:transglutaminase-like domain-containing protein n=1 Tax=uncultured Methylobacterium sp. TaxID=157278 RepID=UPI0035CC2EB0
MRIRLGCEMRYAFPYPVPMVVMLNVHPSRAPALEGPDAILTSPPVPVETYRDSFGNLCGRLIAPAGAFTIGTDAVIADDGARDPTALTAEQHAVEDLPAETLLFLLPSRYCESDLLADAAWRLFGHTAPGWGRVQAVCDFVHAHVAFGYEFAHRDRTAVDAYAGGRGVCRDFTHLAVAFCRALNLPTRYCTGYVSFIGEPEPHPAGDFAAWMEVYLGGRWHVFDPRNNAPRIGRVMVACGRDAADVPLTHTFGPNPLVGFRVWADAVAALDRLDPDAAGPPEEPLPPQSMTTRMG